jgi:integrase
MAPRKPERRKPGTGAIRYKEGREQPWETAIKLGDGSVRYDSFATRPEAEAYLDKLVAERDDEDDPRDITGGSQRFDVFLTKWLNYKRIHIKPKTFEGYVYLCNLAVDQWGARRLDSLKREQADELIAYFYKRRFQNVNQLRAVLRQAFQYALELEYIKKNPFEKAKAPPVHRRKGIALTVAQREQMLEIAAEEDKRWPNCPLTPLWYLYSRLALRKGEGDGLKWKYVDFTAGTMVIENQYTNVGSKTTQSTPKTPKGFRVVPMPPDILEMLKEHRTAQAKRLGKVVTHVFPGKDDAPLSVWHIQHRWEMIRRKAPIPQETRIHDLRHTALTILENKGVAGSVVSAIAGHSSQTMTRHYTDHATLEQMRQALG